MCDAERRALAGFGHTGTIAARFGRLEIFERAEPATFLVRAHGAIGPTLLRADLERARGFGLRHPMGWDYVADTSGVRFASPLNALLLRRIRALPSLRRYFVIAPSLATRVAIRCAAWFVRPDRIVRSFDELG